MGRTFALADLHGQRALWNQIRDYLRPDDRLFFLGDAIDRGPDGYAIMKELLLDSRVTYLMGNHEFMMMEALREIRKYGGEWVGEKLELWTWNGAYSTLEAWEAAGSMYDWIRIIDKEMPEYVEYTNTKGQIVGLSHAGFTPGARKLWRYDAVWDRDHLTAAIPEEYQDGHFMVVHGHTPVPHLLMKFDELNQAAAWCRESGKSAPTWKFREDKGAVFYGEGFIKVDIDCGCFATGHTVLLNLDTWETVGFDAEIEE